MQIQSRKITIITKLQATPNNTSSHPESGIRSGRKKRIYLRIKIPRTATANSGATTKSQWGLVLKMTLSSGRMRKGEQTNDDSASLTFTLDILFDDDFLESLIKGNQKGKKEVVPTQDVKGDLKLRREGDVAVKPLLVDPYRDLMEVAQNLAFYTLEIKTLTSPNTDS